MKAKGARKITNKRLSIPYAQRFLKEQSKWERTIPCNSVRCPKSHSNCASPCNLYDAWLSKRPKEAPMITATSRP